MEEDDSPRRTRKVKFTPKAPTRKPAKPVEHKTEAPDDVEADQTRELLRRVNEGRRGPRVERKVEPVQVAFGQGASTSIIRTFGNHSYGSSRRSTPRLEDFVSDGLPSDGLELKASDKKKKKEYTEPWDYSTNYPVIHPLRKPYSGNPELLDEEEFGEASANSEYDESSINPSVELDLMEECEGERMLFFQLPPLPVVKQSAGVKGKEVVGSSRPSRSTDVPEKACNLEELPAGYVGKMLVHKSGAIELKLGETVYDVFPGMDSNFPQDVAAINTKEKGCVVLGKIDKHVVVTPNVDSLLDSVLNSHR